jgi:hypothetical protein
LVQLVVGGQYRLKGDRFMPVFLQGIAYFHDDAAFPPRGWSEVYNLVTTTYPQSLLDMQIIVTARLSMVPNNVHCSYIRVSDLLIRGDSTIKFPSPAIGSYILTGTNVMLPPDSALVVRMEASPLNRSFRYLHGLSSQDVNDTLWTPSAAMITAYGNWVGAASVLSLHRHKNVGPPISYADTPWTTFIALTVNSRKVGRPFGVPRGRRLIA